MTKIAYGTRSLEELREWVEAGEEAHMTTRYLPKRHEEMVGGSLYWIIDHTLVGRAEILGFAQGADGRYIIRLAPRVIPVEPRPRRAHQGWRYLSHEDAPRDLEDGETPGDVLPGHLMRELARLGLA